ncbi:patatin-like phospholipase family protein [Reinekea thalattae]|uniref:Patatin-like phospholipase family protein n=1 Tax=Reinekea thalattae TaxID=2593301 RepID=A0A5C8Z8X2_9GAMM|nr:patatin-like phospholipase family protein [Reinekea thalattae]TXR53296.1 patatin-like phospholipase family protein [Reinekea thalattae]
MQTIDIYAGKQAFQHIEKNGLKPRDIRVIIGASGGPKWFVLSHLDRYLVSNWLPQIDHQLELVGSSIGAFRMAAYASENPLAAIEQLEKQYINQRYSTNRPSSKEVSQSSIDILKAMLSENDLKHHQSRKLHIITARAKGLIENENKFKQGLGLAQVAAGNYLSRKLLARHFDRVIFQSPGGHLPIEQWDKFKTSAITLSKENYFTAVEASGAIPIVMQGVKDPFGAPKGTYRDGGMVDYHFDLPIKPKDGLVLYPHFSSTIKPGWFDKNIQSRKVSADNYSHTVVICPSQAFIDSLPNGAIPNRKDYTRFDDLTRINNWTTAVRESRKLAEEFQRWYEQGTPIKNVKPIEEICHSK